MAVTRRGQGAVQGRAAAAARAQSASPLTAHPRARATIRPAHEERARVAGFVNANQAGLLSTAVNTRFPRFATKQKAVDFRATGL